MAMTKKEQAAHEAVVKELRIQRALRWTGPQAKADLAPPGGGNEIEGFLYNTGYDDVRIEPAQANSVSHHRGARQKIRLHESWSQGSRWLFSTPLLAAKAARAELERKYAERLEKADALIEALERGETWPLERY